MSQIKTTEVEGDVAVGRHAIVGGNATVRGNTTVKKNLKVEGWLDAKNIKGPNKGIFLTAEKLREAYPLPHDGWWALVGNTLPAPLYIADGGAWVNTGETVGNPTIDSQQYNEAVAELDADLKSLATEVSTNKADIKSIRASADKCLRMVDIYASSWKRYLETDGVDYSESWVSLGDRHTGADDDIEVVPVDIQAATHERAGVMSAEDKRKLDSIVSSPETVSALTVNEVVILTDINP